MLSSGTVDGLSVDLVVHRLFSDKPTGLEGVAQSLLGNFMSEWVLWEGVARWPAVCLGRSCVAWGTPSCYRLGQHDITWEISAGD